MKRSQESASKTQVIDSIVAGVDPAVKDGQLSQQIAEALVGAAMNLEVILPLKEDVVACIDSLFDANKAPRPAASAAGPAAQPAAGTFKGRTAGAYFGQALPGDAPAPFAPEILTSISAWVEATAFSPDGTQFFVSVGAADYSSATLYHSTRVNGEWTPIVEAPFVSDFTYSNEPVFSADGKTLMFTGKKSAGSLDLWTVEYTGQGWGTPVPLPSPINSDAVEYRGSYMSDGTLYFTSGRSGVNQIYRARTDAAHALGVELVARPISTGSPEGDPCIAPDGRFLVFNSARDWKSADLYVSFRDARGGWGTPIDLGPDSTVRTMNTGPTCRRTGSTCSSPATGRRGTGSTGWPSRPSRSSGALNSSSLDISIKPLPNKRRGCSGFRRTRAISPATASPFRQMAGSSTTPKSQAPGVTATSGTTRYSDQKWNGPFDRGALTARPCSGS